MAYSISVCSFEGLMLKLKHQYFGHLMQKADSLEKSLMLEKIEGRKGRGQQRMRWLDGMGGCHHRLHGHAFEPAPGASEGQGVLSWRAAVHGVARGQTRLSNWTTVNILGLGGHTVSVTTAQLCR